PCRQIPFLPSAGSFQRWAEKSLHRANLFWQIFHCGYMKAPNERKALWARYDSCFCLAIKCPPAAQSLGSAGTVEGTVTDPTGAVVAGASVEIQNAVSGFRRQMTTDDAGNFRFTNI